MLENISIHKILFLDVETVPVTADFSELPKEFQSLWAEKTRWQRSDQQSPEEFYGLKAGVMAEFAKVICISVGYLYEKEGQHFFRIKSFYGDNEKAILEDLKLLLDEKFSTPKHYLCAHNGKEFDYPFLCRRMLVNGIQLPKILEISGKKPWEVRHLDTMEMWKFGDYKHYTSIKLLAALFGIPTPKDDIDGSQVSKVYWQDKDLERIKNYCQKDTLTVAQILLKYMCRPILTEEQIEVA
ncbi:MAG: 3'-5' exonuclease [Flavobacteriales bacterium]|nr:3'-5' exonuclease [Flavobacteriales bacterium]MBL6872466.1 3'-5' exonuclease [Flavobacteriales bacterium]